jgi:alkaline phosphatase D
MKIAFTSCMSAQVFPKQPVWAQIAQHDADCLVMTGDAIYIDESPGPVHPKDASVSDFDFAERLFAKYRAQLKQGEFAALVAGLPAYPIWDDHDFLWNESYREGAIDRISYIGKIRASRAMFNAFCRHLATQAPGDRFPDAINDARLWRDNEPAPGCRHVDLGQGVLLHLTDGRSERIGKTLLGAAQRAQIAAAMQAAPPATIHLLASGSVVESHKGDRWAAFDDHDWLLQLAHAHRVMVLSGDIHENAYAEIPLGNGKFLFEATSSGAAIRKLIGIGAECQNHGLLEIGDTALTTSFYSFGKLSQNGPYKIDRQLWKPL